MAVADGLLIILYFFHVQVINFCFVIHVFKLLDTNDF